MVSSIKNYISLFGLTIATGLTLVIGFSLERLFPASIVYYPFYILCYLFGSYTFIVYIYKTLKGVKPDIELLMFLAAIGAAILGKWSEGGLLLFLFGLGNNLESFAMQTANKSLANLSKLLPKTAIIKEGNETREVPVEQLQYGDIIVVRPNSTINADGLVVAGNSSVDEATITGEGMPVEKFPSQSKEKFKDLYEVPSPHRAFAGTMNEQGFLEIMVLKKAKDSTISKLIDMVNEARDQKASVQRFTEKFEQVFVPIILTFVFLLNFAFLIIDESFSDSFYRALTVLVVSSPCALVISAPSTVLCGVARAAKAGVLIKGGKPLEKLGLVEGVAFDKTGTLTNANPQVTDFITLNGTSKTDLIKMVLALEMQSDHILGKSIVRDLKNGQLKELPEISNFTSLTGRGVKAVINLKEVLIGNKRAYMELYQEEFPAAVSEKIHELENEGKTSVIISMAGRIEGIIALMDVSREESVNTVNRLKEMGMKEVVMLTGDNHAVASSIAKQIGITKVLANLMPSDKVAAIQSLIDENKLEVAMVGDGVNDAPALAHSTVGISMGAAGSDVAMESADVVLMSDKLNNLPPTIGLGRKARMIIKQNVFISLGVIAVMIPITLLGLAKIGLAVLIHEGSTVLVAFNAMRLLRFKFNQA